MTVILDVLSFLLGFAFLIGLILLYFLPAIIAGRRDTRQRRGILKLNFFLGWSTFGWIFALVWAISDKPLHPAPPLVRPLS